MAPLAVVLLVQERTDSFAYAGLASGVWGLMAAVSQPLWARPAGRGRAERVIAATSVSQASVVLGDRAVDVEPGGACSSPFWARRAARRTDVSRIPNAVAGTGERSTRARLSLHPRRHHPGAHLHRRAGDRCLARGQCRPGIGIGGGHDLRNGRWTAFAWAIRPIWEPHPPDHLQDQMGGAVGSTLCRAVLDGARPRVR